MISVGHINPLLAHQENGVFKTEAIQEDDLSLPKFHLLSNTQFGEMLNFVMLIVNL